MLPVDIFVPWIDLSVKEVRTILASASTDGLVAFPVSRDVNNVRNDNARLIERVEELANGVPTGKTPGLF
jgi:putative SOS response-associated peptidase YedK